MNKQLKVDVIPTKKSKNSFGNSFTLDNDPFASNQFQGFNPDDINNSLSNLKKKQQQKNLQVSETNKNKSKVDHSPPSKSKVFDQKNRQQPIKQVNTKQKNKKNNNSKAYKQQKQLHETIQIQQHIPKFDIKNKKKNNSFVNLDQQQQSEQQKVPKKKIKKKNYQETYQSVEFDDQQNTKKGSLQKNKSKQKNINEKQNQTNYENQKINKNNQKQHNHKDQGKQKQKQSKNSFKNNNKKQTTDKAQKLQDLQKSRIKQKHYNNLNSQNKKVQFNKKTQNSPIIKKSDQQKSKIYDIKQNITKLNSSINTINNDYKQIERIDAADQILFRKNNRLKEFQIRQFLTKKRLEKQRRQQKIKQLRQRENEQISKTIQMKQQQKKIKQQQKIKIIKQIDYIRPKQKRQRYLQEQQQRKRMAQSVIEKYKNHQPIHVRKMKQFQEKENIRKQKERQILMQRKQRFQSLDFQQLDQHKRLHEQRLQELQNMKKDQRQQQLNKIMQDNNLMKDQIWKGPSHDYVDQERLQMKRKKKQPKQKVKKMKNYYQHIKKNLLPKTHQPKRSSPIHNAKITQSLGNYSGRYHSPDQQMLAHYDPGKKHVKKYKFLQGKAIGQIIQSVPVARSHSQQRKIGEGYLQYLKNLPKKKQNSQSTTQIDSQDLQMINRKFNQVTKVKRQSIPFYQNNRRKKTISISQQPTKQQVKMVYEKLKNQDIKLKSKRQLIRALKNNSPKTYEYQKQLNADMVLNMERKLDLLTKL